MNKWQELTIEVNREVEEAASNILIESGSQGVAIDEMCIRDRCRCSCLWTSYPLRLAPGAGSREVTFWFRYAMSR